MEEEEKTKQKKTKQWSPRAEGWSMESGMSCLGSILHNIHIKHCQPTHLTDG